MTKAPISLLLLGIALGCNSGDTTIAPELGYIVQANGTPPTSAPAGSTVLISAKVLHKETGGGTTPAGGVTITLEVLQGGGVVNGTASSTVITASDGTVTASWLLGAAVGVQTLRGAVSISQYLDFTLVATAPQATQFAIATQPAASASSDIVLTRQPTVQLKDASGNNVAQAGVPVTVAIASGGGTLGGTLTVNTDASGLATFTDLSLSGPARSVTLNFSATLSGQSVSAASSAISVVLSPVTSVVLQGLARMKVGQVTGYAVELKIANGIVVQRPVVWSILVPGTATITGTGVVNPFLAGTITIVATVEGVAYQFPVPSYDWVAVTSGPTTSVSLTSQNAVTNFGGVSEFPNLIFDCTSGVFSVRISFSTLITGSGAVTYTWVNAVPASETWQDPSPFKLLSYPGLSNLARKNFALGVAANWNQFFTFDLSFGELAHGTQTASYNLTGISAALAPVLAACPGN